MTHPLVSVIIPAYRCDQTIERAIESALIQSVPSEIIVINDQSPDHLDAVMERYQQFSEIIYIKNDQNLGAAKSRNKGVSMARGKYVAFLDSDDQWAPEKLKKQIETLEETGMVLCCTARELMTPKGEGTGRVIPVRQVISYRELLKHNCINCSSVLIRAEVAKEFPMEHEDSHEDYIMWLKVLKKYGPAAGINEPLLKYRLSNTGKSGNKLKSAKMTFRVYRYMGFGLIRSAACFISYMFHGVVKYLCSWL